MFEVVARFPAFLALVALRLVFLVNLINAFRLLLYGEQAAMNTEGKVGWEEIVDSRLEGKIDVQELNEVAALAYKCINRIPRKRPSMRDIVQVLSRILKLRYSRNHHKKSLSATAEEVTIDVDQSETKTTHSEHRRDESMDSSMADTYEA